MTDDERCTTHDDGLEPTAKCHLSDSDKIKIME